MELEWYKTILLPLILLFVSVTIILLTKNKTALRVAVLAAFGSMLTIVILGIMSLEVIIAMVIVDALFIILAVKEIRENE